MKLQKGHMKKIAITAVFVWCLAFSSFSQVQQLTNILTGNFTGFGMSARTNVEIDMTIISPLNRLINGIFISNDPIPTYTDTNGGFNFTNIQWGKYRISPKDSSSTFFTAYVGTNTIGTWALGSLVTNSAALPPNPGTNYYTQSQIDAIIAGTKISASTNLLWGSKTNSTEGRAAWIYYYFPTNSYNSTNYPYGIQHTN